MATTGYQGAIFDVDGVLVDSPHERAWREALRALLEGEWADSTATFAAVQVRREFAEDWHALAEHRWLDVKHGGTRRGWLVGIDRDIGRNFRVGVGYNFTEFSDDLTDFDYDHRGWFINFVGSY